MSNAVSITISQLSDYGFQVDFDVAIRLPASVQELAHFDRCAGQFEDYCVVTESIRHGIPVPVRVLDRDGVTVHDGGVTEEGMAATELV
jgi:hypothetical protein